MEKLKMKLTRKTDQVGIFHNSREDVKTLMKAINAIQDKVNELIDENEDLKQQIKSLNNQIYAPC